MKYWLMKSEPDAFSIDDLMQKPRKTQHWDGVRNYQARNMMRDEMRKGDQVFFYHSSCKEPGIAGIAEVVKEAYPDFTAADPESKYYDPKHNADNPRWFMVDIRFRCKFDHVISLKQLKSYHSLADLRLLARGNRLSIMPVSKKHWDFILKLADKAS